jgi:histidine phosphotransfer protein HptB
MVVCCSASQTPPCVWATEPLGHGYMIQENTNGESIYSRLGGDPDLHDIVEMFVEEMPGRVARLLDHLSDGNWDGLRQVAHQLKGAAGSYGFEPISPSAGRVESAVRDGEPEQRIREAVLALVDLCGRVRSGQPA